MLHRPRLVALLLLATLAGCTTAPKPEPGVEVSLTEPAPPVPLPAPPPPPPVVIKPLPPPPAPPTNHVAAAPVETWQSLEQWAVRHGFGAPKRTAAVPPTFTLSCDKAMLVVAAGNREARWNGTELLLGFPPRLAGNTLQIHALDVAKNLQPLVATSPLPRATNRVIVIDPGHGGMDSGARSAADGRNEKDFTLDWAQRLRGLLSASGWTVFLTRTNDTNPPLAQRVAFAEQHRADLFISLHFNSAYPRQDRAGLETYLLTPAGMPSNLTRGYGDDASQAFPNNGFDAENLQYAMRLHRALLQVNGSPDRGVRRARFLGVLRGQNRPAVLVEGGYLSNPAEARKIAQPAYRQKLAEAVARALE